MTKKQRELFNKLRKDIVILSGNPDFMDKYYSIAQIEQYYTIIETLEALEKECNKK